MCFNEGAIFSLAKGRIIISIFSEVFLYLTVTLMNKLGRAFFVHEFERRLPAMLQGFQSLFHPAYSLFFFFDRNGTIVCTTSQPVSGMGSK